jgi:hypothetical protein
MNKRTAYLVGAILVLAAAYNLAFFMDWHKRPEIQIFCEKSRGAIMHGSESPNLIFHLVKSYPLTSIEVVEAEDARTNKYPHPLWHVLAEDKPVPTTSFAYGAAIHGMKPEIPTAMPEPLEVDTEYLLLVEAGKKIKGKLLFQLPF